MSSFFISNLIGLPLHFNECLAFETVHGKGRRPTLAYTFLSTMNANANDQLKGYNCSDYYYKHSFGMLYTDGARAMAEMFECYWFLDIIVSYQPQLKDHEFQVWSLGRNGDHSAIVLCSDGNDKILKSQEIPYTDFKPTDATLWVENGVILLPSEH